MARKPAWAEKIIAPEEALEFYRLVQKLQSSAAFRTCHIYGGTNINHIPMISWSNKTTALPRMILGFLGIPYRKQICKTHGCCNPFHYVDVENRSKPLEGMNATKEEVHKGVGLEDYIELVEYTMDKEGYPRDVAFQIIRRAIDPTDCPDDILKLCLQKMNES